MINIDEIKASYEEMVKNINNEEKLEALKTKINILIIEANDRYGEKAVTKEYRNFIKTRWA